MIRMLSLVTLCAAVAAQDKVSPNRFVPEDSLVVARLGAPAAWKQQFGKTQVRKLLDGPTLAPLLAQAEKAFAAGLEEAKKDGKIAPELIDGLFEAYTGEVVFALQMDFADLPAAMKEDRPPAMSGIISLSPDGKYDLPALATALEKLLETEGGQPLHDLTVGDHRLRFVDDKDMNVSAPTMVDGHLVWLFAADLEKSAAKLLAVDDRFEGGTSGAPFYVHAELDAAVTGFLEAMKVQMADVAEQMPFDPIELFRDAFGLACLKSLDMSIVADGEHVMLDASLTTKEGERGLLGVVLVDQGAPKLLRFLPPSAEALSCGPIDVDALYRTIAKIWTDLGDQVPMTFADAEAAFTESTKVRLKEDLIDHFGTEMLLLTDPEAQLQATGAIGEGEEPDLAAVFSGYCFGLALRDGKAFGESLEKALRSRGLHAARKTEEYQGIKVHRLRLAAVFEVEYAVTDELLLIALGSAESGHQHLRGVLDARASGATAAPEAVTKRLADLPAGWGGVQVTPVASTLLGFHTMMAKMGERQPMPEEAAMVFSLLPGLAADMKRLGIDYMVGATYTTKGTFTTRVRW